METKKYKLSEGTSALVQCYEKSILFQGELTEALEKVYPPEVIAESDDPEEENKIGFKALTALNKLQIEIGSLLSNSIWESLCDLGTGEDGVKEI